MTSEQLKLLVDTVQQLSLARNLEAVMTVVRSAARKLTGADGATFILRDNGKCYYADEDAIAPLWKGQRFPLESCISGWAMLNKQPVIIEDIYVDDRVPIVAYRPTFVKSLMMVPIRTIDPIGAIGNYWSKQRMPTAEEVQLLQSLADITSVSLENVYVYNELEDRVKQRTQELVEANKELEAFSYSVSHDLRAPLRAISGRLNYLIEDYGGKQFNADAQNDVRTVIKAAKDMDELIESLLDFSKSGKKELSVAKLHMKKIVEEICRSLQEQEKEREITFEINEIPDAEGDEILIKQVWANLLNNAVKYTAQKQRAEIKIGAETDTKGINYFVKDNGAGFDMKYYSKMFGIFQRLHTSSEFNGNGIGLALVQRILQRHGGAIWAKGKTGEGAEFSFSLPA